MPGAVAATPQLSANAASDMTIRVAPTRALDIARSLSRRATLYEVSAAGSAGSGDILLHFPCRVWREQRGATDDSKFGGCRLCRSARGFALRLPDPAVHSHGHEH